jgi:hypothetical protein
MKNMKFNCYVMLVLIAASGCTGRMAKIEESWLKDEPAPAPTKQKAEIPFSVSDKGIEIYKGHPSTIGYKTWAVTVDLKTIQEVAANKALNNVSVNPSEKVQDVRVQSYITDFRYKWPFPWPTKRSFVSFTLNIDAIGDNKTLVSRSIDVKDFAGSESKQFLIPPEIIIDKLYTKVRGFEHQRSEMVAKATLEAVYGVYKKELPGIINGIGKQK